MATTKNLETILGELRTFIKAYNRQLDTGDNSLIHDLFLMPYALGAKSTLDQVTVAANLHLLSQLYGFDLDNEATNYKLERLPGRYSTATVVFYTATAPAGDVVIPAGTQVQTSQSAYTTSITFSTIAEATFAVSSAAAYYSYDRDRYEFPVVAVCDMIGTVSNIGSGMVTRLVTSVTGVTGATNLTAAVGGQDEEIDDDLRSRIMLAITGRDLNVVNGLRGYVRGFNFTDAYPVRVEDTDAERYDGIDVFVIESQVSSQTDSFTYYSSTPKYYLSKPPVTAVTAVTGPGGPTAQYDAYIDSTTQYRRSSYANDYLEIRASALFTDGDVFTVSYNYVENVRNMQSEFDKDDNRVLTANVVVKRAYTLYLNMTATLTLKASTDGPATRTKVRNALAQFLSGYRLGVDIQKSDLIVVLQTGYGNYPVNTVDAVVISSYNLVDAFGATRNPVDETISVGDKEYVVYGTITIL